MKRKIEQDIEKLISGIFEQSQSVQLQVFNKQPTNKFERALRKLQEQHIPSFIFCRDEEQQYIRNFIKNAIQTKSSKNLYLSGVPGIGKTLCVKHVASQIQNMGEDKCKVMYVNALNVRQPRQIYKAIYYALTNIKTDRESAKYMLSELFIGGLVYGDLPKSLAKVPKVLIIDQIDYLIMGNSDQEVIYNIFQWIQYPKSRLSIISISNTSDFPQRLEPKVASRMGTDSKNFKQYTSQQIEVILNDRIKEQNIFEQQALNFICKKIAHSSSDIRRCLYILRESIFEYQRREKGKNKQEGQIGVQILSKIRQQICKNNFTQNFNSFPRAYKIVLRCLVKYFQNQTQPCSFRQLEHMCGPFIKSINQLKPILLDLRDLKVIKLNYGFCSRMNNRINNFQNIRQLKQEQIRLSVVRDDILYCLQKQNPQELNINKDTSI